MRYFMVCLLMLEAEKADPKNDHVFQKFISGLIEEGIFTEKELADGLLVSIFTIKRWAGGRNLPGIAIRRSIYKALYQKLDKISN